jgi:hypothetical protein
VVLLVFACPQIVRAPEGVQIFPPTHIASFRIDTGTLINMKKVDPAHFSQKDPANEVLGAAQMPKGLTFESFMKLRRELFEAEDRLLAPFRDGVEGLAEEQKDAARRFRRLFDQLHESVLSPYYEALGNEFFKWLEGAAR